MDHLIFSVLMAVVAPIKAQPLFIVNDNGNVGVATAAPAALFTIGNGTMVVTAFGNVGIGTTTPAAALA